MVLKRWAAKVLAVAVLGAGFCGAARGDDAATYQHAAATFQKGDHLAAARELAQLAPFDGPDGGRARYLLGRVHQLAGEKPEAAADYQAVLTWWEAHKAGAPAKPEYVERADFYEGVLLGEQGKTAPAIERLKAFTATPFGAIKKTLGAEAVLWIGLLQLGAKQYPAAIETLRPLREDTRFGDQALWFTARAVIRGAPADPAAWKTEMNRGLDKLKLAAAKAETLAKTDAEARLRRIDELLDLADAQMTLKQYTDAVATCNTVAGACAELPEAKERQQEAMARAIAGLELSGKFAECEAAAARFESQWPKSLLLGAVRFREAQSLYLHAQAENDNAALGTAIEKLARMVRAYPEYVFVSEARMAWGTALYHMQRFGEAAEVLKGIPGSDRSGDLATASLMLGDSLLRTMPPEGEDALSAARMLMQAEQATAELSEFVRANPAHPQLPLAEFKLAYCYQRMGSVLSDTGGEKWKMWQQARDTYGKLLAALPPENPLAAEATFERGKVLALMGDAAAALGELGKFRDGPLAKSSAAPVALLRLAAILRQQGKPQDGADALAKWLTNEQPGKPAAAAASQAATSKTADRVIGLLRYEQGVCLKEAGKIADARAVFAALQKENPDAPESISSQWRLAQIDREALAARLTEAQRRFAAAHSVPESAAAATELDAATRAMQDWVKATAELSAAAITKAGQGAGGQGAIRLSYELGWGYRALADAQIAQKKSASVAGVEPDGTLEVSTLTGDAAAHEPVEDIGLTPADIQARGAYREAIRLGDMGDDAEQEAANLARQDLGEMLAQRGLVDEAMDLFTEVLEHGSAGPGNVREVMRPRMRIAECLLAKNDADGALGQIALTLRPGARMGAEARYVSGEAYAQLHDPKKAIETLRMFEDDSYYPGEFGERALLRLGDLLLADGKSNEAKSVFTALLKKYPRSTGAAQAKWKLGLCTLTTEVMSNWHEANQGRNH